MLGIEIARIDAVPLIVEDLKFRYETGTSVMQERPLAFVLCNEVRAQPVEPPLESKEHGVQGRRRPQARKAKLQRTLLRRGFHECIFA